MPTDKEFEDLFREQLNGLEEAPPPKAWEAIREEIKPRRTNTGWYVVLPALLFLIGIGTFFGLRKPAPAQKTLQSTVEIPPVSQPENGGQKKQNTIVPYEAGKKEKPAKEELIIPGTERNSVYRTYLAVKKDAAKNNLKTPVLEASAKQRNSNPDKAQIGQVAEDVSGYGIDRKIEALKIAEETNLTLADGTSVESPTGQAVLNQNMAPTKQKGVTEAITETFAPQTYPEAIADTINNMVLEVPYTVQPERKSWFNRFTSNLGSLFSSGK